MLRRVLSEYWRKETEKSKVFLWGGRFGWSLLCSGSAEKETRGSLPTTGAYLSTETNLVPIHCVMRKEFETGHTRTRTHTHTHTRNLSAVDRQVPGAGAHVTPSKNKFTCMQ